MNKIKQGKKDSKKGKAGAKPRKPRTPARKPSPRTVAREDAKWMEAAAAMSLEGMRAGRGGPFGAVLVRDGKVIGRGCNRVLETGDPTAHAEVVAIREACREAGSFHLEGAVLYTSCEPCPMCLGAAYWARVARIVFANTRRDAARIGFSDQFIYEELALPMSGRKVPIRRLSSAAARGAFEEWKAKADRIPY